MSKYLGRLERFTVPTWLHNLINLARTALLSMIYADTVLYLHR